MSLTTLAGNIGVSGTNITVAKASAPLWNDSDADDARKAILALVDAFANAYIATETKPSRMSASKSVSSNGTTGSAGNTGFPASRLLGWPPPLRR